MAFNEHIESLESAFAETHPKIAAKFVCNLMSDIFLTN